MIDKKKPVFRVIFSVEPAVRIGKERKLDFDFGELILKEDIHPEMGIAKGLLIYVTLNSTNCTNATTRARGVLIRALDWLSFHVAASLPNPRILKCYEVTSGEKKGQFEQYHYIDFLDPVSVRQIDIAELSQAYESILKHKKSHQDRLYRAMHWYRLAFQSEDYIDRFTAVWIGLETINPILKKHYQLEKKYQDFDGKEVDFEKCPECGHKPVQMLNGVNHLLKEVIEDEESISDVRKLRRETLHGFGLMSEITPKAKELLPKLTVALDMGLRMLLGLSEQSDLKPLNLWSVSPKFYRTEATIKGPNLEHLDKETIPSLDRDIESIGYKSGVNNGNG